MLKGSHLTNEHKAKLSVAGMGHPFMGLRHPSAEIRAKVSAALMGHRVSPETRAKISLAQKGKIISLETREKESVAHWKGGPPVWHRKANAKHRTLGFVPLNKPFEGCNGHHIDREHVIYVPEELHQSVRHNVWNGRNMKEMNDKAFAWLSSQLSASLGPPAPSERPSP